jgi:hypothetical protein
MNPTAPCPPADNERRTPDWIIASARTVLGTIDLDPASDLDANERVGAIDYFDMEDNGLDHFWYGKVFLNPPGGKLDPETLLQSKNGYRALSSSAVWWGKLLHEMKLGNTTEAIYVAFNLEAMLNTQNIGAAYPIQEFTFCVPARRVEYPSKHGAKSKTPGGATAIVYLGDNQKMFFNEFSKHGYVKLGRNVPGRY